MTRLEPLNLSLMINTAVAEHGALRVVMAALAASLRATRRGPYVPDLPDYLRRDVGLPDANRRRPFPELFR